MSKRKPDQLKVLQGTYRQDRAAPGGITPATEPTPPLAELPTPPDYLTAEERKEWFRYGADCVARQVLYTHDLPALEQLARTAALEKRLASVIEREGFTVENPDSGAIHPHPCMRMWHDARTHLQRHHASFGIGKLDRRQPPPPVPAIPTQEELYAQLDPLEKLMVDRARQCGKRMAGFEEVYEQFADLRPQH